MVVVGQRPNGVEVVRVAVQRHRPPSDGVPSWSGVLGVGVSRFPGGREKVCGRA